jgi:WD40 repeat protein
MNDVFISYSRRDKVFTKKLYEALKAANRTIWADWDSIPAASDWFAEIKEGIEQTESVLFVLSPEWIKSGECRKELTYAVEMGKRLFPIVWQPVDPNQVPPELAKINWVYMREGDDFDKAFQTLCSAMDTDLDWIKAHTRLQVRALEWDKKKRDHSFVLRGNDLTDGEQFVSKAANKSPATTPLQGEYILASRKDASRRQRQTLIGVTAALIVSVALGVVAFFQRQAAVAAEATAVKERDRAVVAEADALTQRDRAVAAEAETKKALIRSESERLAAEAHVVLSDPLGDPETAMLLSLKSLQSGYYPQSDSALVESIQKFYTVAVYHDESSTAQNYSSPVALSPDGNIAAVARNSENQIKVELYDTVSGQLTQTINFNATVNDITVSPDGKYLAVARGDGNAELFDMNAGESVQEYSGHSASVSSVAFSPDSQYLLTGSYDNTAQLWDIQSGSSLKTFSGPTLALLSVAFSPDGNFVVASSDDQNAYKWDIATATLIGSVSEYNKILDTAISPDGQTLVTVTDRKAALWNLSNNELIYVSNHPNWVNSVAFSPDGKYFVTGGDDSMARIWDAETGQLKRALVGHTRAITSIAFSLDGRYVITGSLDGTARLWNADLQNSRGILRGHTNTITDVAVSPDGKSIVTGGWDADLNNSYKLWDVQTGKSTNALIGHTWLSSSVSFSKDGRYVLTGSGDGSVRIWDAATGAPVQTIQVTEGQWVNSATFSPDGKYVLAGGDTNTATLWDAQTGENLLTLEHPAAVSSVAISPDGKLALTACGDSNLRLWDLQTGDLIRTFTGHAAPSGGYQNIESITFSPDGKWILSGSVDGTARLWDVSTGDTVQIFRQEGFVLSVAISPDGIYGLTGGSDRTARLWNLQTGELVRTYIGHTDSIFGVAFSQDGKFIVTSSADTTVRIWDTNYHDTVSLACSLLHRALTPAELETYKITDTSAVCT